jgi:hypothetical protein
MRLDTAAHRSTRTPTFGCAADRLLDAAETGNRCTCPATHGRAPKTARPSSLPQPRDGAHPGAFPLSWLWCPADITRQARHPQLKVQRKSPAAFAPYRAPTCFVRSRGYLATAQERPVTSGADTRLSHGPAYTPPCLLPAPTGSYKRTF